MPASKLDCTVRALCQRLGPLPCPFWPWDNVLVCLFLYGLEKRAGKLNWTAQWELCVSVWGLCFVLSGLMCWSAFSFMALRKRAGKQNWTAHWELCVSVWDLCLVLSGPEMIWWPAFSFYGIEELCRQAKLNGTVKSSCQHLGFL